MKPIALNMVAEIARHAETSGLPISGIGGIEKWRDAVEFMALGAAMCRSAPLRWSMASRSSRNDGRPVGWMDEKGYASVDDIVGRAVPRVTDWQHLNSTMW